MNVIYIDEWHYGIENTFLVKNNIRRCIKKRNDRNIINKDVKNICKIVQKKYNNNNNK